MIDRPSIATINDLHRVEGKAELVRGRIVEYPPSGHLPAVAALEIAVQLREYAKIAGGDVFGGTLAYAVNHPLTSGRQSFSPDASYYVGPHPTNPMQFIEGAPLLAVEVRSEEDYGPVAEAEMRAKRADYFEAGTKVVWDVDPLARTIASYRHDQPDTPITFHAGERANAEPALPTWSILVDEVFPSP